MLHELENPLFGQLSWQLLYVVFVSLLVTEMHLKWLENKILIHFLLNL